MARVDNPFQIVTRLWMQKIKLAVDFKRDEFQLDAEEATRFFDGPHDFMYRSDYATKSGAFQMASEDGRPQPTFRMTVNKVAEMVQLFGPYLYHQNPHRTVSPRKQVGIPAQLMMQQQVVGEQLQMLQQQLDQSLQQTNLVDSVRASLMEAYLNYTPNELDLKSHSRQAIDECLIKGLGVLWHEVYIPEGTQQRFVRSVYDSVDNLVLDPDMESIRDCKWCARRRVLPVWEVENRFGIKSGTIKGNLSSLHERAYHESGSMNDPETNYYRPKGETNDLLAFWEVFSRMGIGHLAESPHATYWPNQYGGPYKAYFEQFGPHVYLAVCDDYSYPLNIPDEVFQNGSREDVFFRSQWPTPFWADPAHPWPFSHLEFHPRPRKLYPMSHLKPALGELKFINWAMSFLADKVKNTSRDFIAVLKSASEDIKTAILTGRDLAFIEISKQHGKSINEIVQFLQHPPMNQDIWRVLEQVITLFEQRTGMTPLMYGESARQHRSAEESRIKGEATQTRPQDMANRVEDWMTLAARKEALAARWHVRPEDVVQIMGPAQAQLWGRLITSSEVQAVTHELEYRIEAGSIRKPNRERDIQNATQSVQVWGPLLSNYGFQTGDFTPLNALSSYWAKANDLEPQMFQINPPPPQPEEPDQAEVAKAEMEQAKAQQESQQDAEKHEMEMERASANLQAQTLSMGMDMQQERFKLAAQAQEEQIKLVSTIAINQAKLEGIEAQNAAKRKGARGNGSKK